MDYTTTHRAEEIREATGMAWEYACRRAERERDERIRRTEEIIARASTDELRSSRASWAALNSDSSDLIVGLYDRELARRDAH